MTVNGCGYEEECIYQKLSACKHKYEECDFCAILQLRQNNVETEESLSIDIIKQIKTPVIMLALEHCIKPAFHFATCIRIYILYLEKCDQSWFKFYPN